MVNIFNEIPFYLEEESVLKIELRCRSIQATRGKEQEDTFYLEFYYIVKKFDYKSPQFNIFSDEGVSKDKKGPIDYPSLSGFCDKWSKLFLEDILCNLLSVEVNLLDLRIQTLNRTSGKSAEVEYRYPLSLYGKRVGPPGLIEEVFYFDLLYKGSAVLRPLYLKGVSLNFDVRDPNNKEILEAMERLYLLTYSPDNKINLQPVRVTKPPITRNTPPSRRGVKVLIPSSVQARGFKSRRLSKKKSS